MIWNTDSIVVTGSPGADHGEKLGRLSTCCFGRVPS